MDYFNSQLPVEITVDILARLPTEEVLDSKLVCTRWRNIVSNHPSFSKMHFHHHQLAQDSCYKLGFLASTFSGNKDNCFYYIEYNEKNHDDDEESTTPIQTIKTIKFTSPVRNSGRNVIAGSYNGLVCLVCNQDVCVFNPVTREYVILPKVKTGYGDVYRYNFCFGYVCSTNKYKVLVILVKKTKAEEAYIYTLGSRSGWRNLGNLDFEFEACVWSEPGVFANGAIYWMMGDKCKMIVTFDLAEEKFCEHLSPPPLLPESIWRHNSIAVFNGLLLFYAYQSAYESPYQGGIPYVIWLLEKKEERDEHQSLGWRQEFRITKSMNFLAFTKSDEVLTTSANYLTIYNTKTSTLQRLVKFKNWIERVFPHENTLVSLKELGEEDTKVMESVEETKSRDQLLEDADPEYIYL